MTHPNDIAQKVVDDIQAASTVIAALGSGATAGSVTRYEQNELDKFFLQALQSLEAPAAIVAVENVSEGPGGGVWWVTSIGIYLRIAEGGDYFTFLHELVTHEVSGLPWAYHCLIEGQTRQPGGFRMTREVFGGDQEIQVIRFTVDDITTEGD